jgi:membrane protein insertase Oxa1/YidC/SpoIIIJ
MNIVDLPIIKQIADLFGLLMRGLYVFSSYIGIENVVFSIILFVILSKIILLNSTYKKQKLTLLSPSLEVPATKINEKYKDKLEHPLAKNKINIDRHLLFDKYNLKSEKGCLMTLLQLPVIIALYAIVQNMPKYVPELSLLSPEKFNDAFTFLSFPLNDVPSFGSLIILFPLITAILQFIESILTSNFRKDTPQAKQVVKTLIISNLAMCAFTFYFIYKLPLICSIYWSARSICDIITILVFKTYIKSRGIEHFEKTTLKKKNKSRIKRGLEPIVLSA